MSEESAEVVIDVKKVSKACKIICDVLEARNVDKVTAACAMKVLVIELEKEGVIVEVKPNMVGMH